MSGLKLKTASQPPLADPLLLRAALEFAEAQGVLPDEVLAQIGLTADSINRKGTLLEAGAISDAIEVAAKLSGMTDFGIQLVKRTEFRNYGPIGMAAEHAKTLLDAALDVARFVRIINESVIADCYRYADGYALTVSVAHLGQFRPIQHTEAMLMLGLELCRHYNGQDWRPHRVCFAHAPASSAKMYNAYFGTEVEFGQPQNMINGTRMDFEREAQRSSSHLREMAKGLLNEIDRTREVDLVLKARALLKGMIPSGHTSVTALAAALGVSERTLQRKLSEGGQSFKQVLADARCEIVQDVCAREGVTVTELTPLLGFSGDSSTSRFLKEHCAPPGLHLKHSAPKKA